MKTLRYPLALFAALVLCLLTAPAPRADTTTMTGGAGAFRLEQAYVNVPDMNVFFYAQDAEGNAYTPTTWSCWITARRSNLPTSARCAGRSGS